MAGVAMDRANIEALLERTQGGRVAIDDGDVILFVSEVLRQRTADLART